MTKTLADFEKRTTRTHIYKKCTTNTVHWLVIGQNQTKNTTCLIISQNGQPKCPIKAVIFMLILSLNALMMCALMHSLLLVTY